MKDQEGLELGISSYSSFSSAPFVYRDITDREFRMYSGGTFPAGTLGKLLVRDWLEC